jgi:hypothetical protein
MDHSFAYDADMLPVQGDDRVNSRPGSDDVGDEWPAPTGRSDDPLVHEDGHEDRLTDDDQDDNDLMDDDLPDDEVEPDAPVEMPDPDHPGSDLPQTDQPPRWQL